MQLPEQYLQKIHELLGEESDAFTASFLMPANHALRVNTLKTTDERLLSLLGMCPEKVPFADHGYYADGDRKLSADPLYFAGLYYLQEPSAMLPAHFLPVSPGDLVLDLCAAPGGKSTQILSKLNGTGVLLSNDISASRAQALLKNLELTGAANYFVSAEDPHKLASVYGVLFDKILVDAPCSGEGMFRKDPALIKSWQERGPKYYAPLQEEILETAFSLLKPGGQLVYSTCTFSPLENEANILKLLEGHPDLHPVALPHEHGLSEGLMGLHEAVRAYPHRIRGEGHFVVLLQKDKREAASPVPGSFVSSDLRLPDALRDYLSIERLQADENRILTLQDHVYLLPKGGEVLYRKGLRFLRTGLLLGSIDRHGRFKPDQALAMALCGDDLQRCVDLPAKDERVRRYLRGETVFVSDEECRVKTGDVLFCTHGFPLGFARTENGRLKNGLRPGWRIS